MRKQYPLPLFKEKLVDYAEYFHNVSDDVDVCEEVDEHLKSEAIEIALNSLHDREKNIIINRFYYGKSLAATGDILGISSERTRQIERKAIRKLRHPTRAENLSHHYFNSQEEYEKFLGENLLREIERENSRLNIKATPKPQKAQVKNKPSPPCLGISPYNYLPIRKPTRKEKTHMQLRAWWSDQADRVEHMKCLKYPPKEFHGQCSCKTWNAIYQLPIKSFECLCCQCYEKFMMKTVDERS